MSFVEDINDEKSNFVAKNDLLPYNIFCEKNDSHSKRERMEIISLHRRMILLKTATNPSKNGFFR